MTRPNMRTLQMQDTIDRQKREIDRLWAEVERLRELLDQGSHYELGPDLFISKDRGRHDRPWKVYKDGAAMDFDGETQNVRRFSTAMEAMQYAASASPAAPAAARSEGEKASNP